MLPLDHSTGSAKDRIIAHGNRNLSGLPSLRYVAACMACMLMTLGIC